MNYLDFDLEIGPGTERVYPVTARSQAGEARITMRFPFDEQTLKQHLDYLQIALQSPDKARGLSAEKQAVQDFGKSLFNALIAGEVRSRYDVSREQASQQSMGLRLKLHILAPELAALPWEFLYDPRQPDFMCLSRHTPVIRYLDMPQSIHPLMVKPPLRILGMIASPSNLAALDIEREKQLMRAALQDLEADGLVKLDWLAGQTWRDLQEAMWRGPWHVFHFIGHGGFDSNTGEGLIALASETGQSHLLTATQLGSLLADHGTIRLALLNACEGAHGSILDIFSSTASPLAYGGIPAVLAMQYEITDDAAIEFTRTFYNALASDMSVDAAVAEARKAIRISATNTLEWGTPVLYMRSPNGILFDLQMMPAVAAQQEQATPPSIATPPGDAPMPPRKVATGTAAPMDMPLVSDRVGQQLGNYRLIRLLGQGSFTEVYLGEHIYLSTQAAVKTLLTHLEGAEVERFHKEARIIARLEHPHIVHVLDFGVENDIPYLIMSYAPNGTLRQRHPEGTPLSLATILPYVQQAAEALQYIHDEGLIHRNVKPENMMLGRRNEVLLTDSSINVITQSILHQSKLKFVGAVAYKAPEQLQGNPRPASDQYALGVVVYEWLCGDQPFHGSVMEVYGQHLYVLPPPPRAKLPTISPTIERVVLKALAKNPDDRYTSVQEFANALKQASVVEETVIEKPPSKPPSVASQANLQPLPSVPHVPADEPTQPASTPTPGSGQAASVPAVVGVADAAHYLAPGTEVARRRYKIDKLVTVGSTGAIYSAIDTRLNRLCAIKEMVDNLQSEAERRQALEWFSREARLLLNLNHPYIVRIYDFFIKGNRYYLVMDFIEGTRTLSEVLEKEGHVTGLSGARGVSQARARSWGQQLCNALSYLHRQTPPIIFRDLKPPNILVTQRDEIRLIDFGIAHTLQPQGRSTIMIIGYTPLEQLHGMPEPRSDIYALGATLYRILTHYDAANNRPSLFSYPALRMLRPDVSPAFEQIVMKALAAAPEQRWSSAAEMEQAIMKLW